MLRPINILTATSVAVSLLLPAAALAFNPRPDSPGKLHKQSKSSGRPGHEDDQGQERLEEPVRDTKEQAQVIRSRC